MRITREKKFWTCFAVLKFATEEEAFNGQQLVILALPQVFFAKTSARAHRVIAQLEGRDLLEINDYGNFTSRNAGWRLQTVWNLVAKMVFEASDPIPKNQVHLFVGIEQAPKGRSNAANRRRLHHCRCRFRRVVVLATG